jgi:hypothetical protein
VTSARDVASGFAYFGEKILKAWSANRRRAEWIEAFYGVHLREAILRFEGRISRAAQRPEPQCWVDGWAAIARFRKDLGVLKDEYDGVQLEREKETFVAEIKEQLALV